MGPRSFTDFIERILKRASRVARDNFGRVSSVTKVGDNNQVLTETDLAIGQMIVGEIKNSYPRHNVIDEEAGVIDRKAEFTWVVDPIDGTSNFAAGVPMYGIMIGLLGGSTPVAGGIALPSFSEICIAERGKGAWCNGEKLRASRERELLKTLFAYGIDGHQENPEMTREECTTLANIVLGIRNLRSSNSVFDAVMVAKGKYSGYINRTSKIWDNVAQQVVLEEAGCIYTDFYGRPIDYSIPLTRAKQNFTFCAAPPLLHKQLQDIIE